MRYFSRLRDIADINSEAFHVDDGATVSDLLTRVIARHDGIAPLRSSLLVARNLEYTALDAVILDGDALDLMPPVSGG